MKKKIFILALASLFFASSTAFPVVVHYCSMSKAMMAKMPAQDNCKMNMESCQSNLGNSKEPAVNNTESYRQPDCCSYKIVDNHLKDNFVQVNESNNFSFSKIVIDCISLESLSYNYYPTFSHSDNSAPPITQQNHIYLDNSVLLI
ncbi:MAG TPA: hypothetical protein VMV32_08470 [Ignavibacteriaceae bacterium]|nr:hypothetical protein [Ignavibacteriaceae bacterium]